jgi:flagellar biosynthesis component FlhA
MVGAILVVLAIVVVIPVSLMMLGGVVAALLGWSLKEHAEATHEGSELIDLNY